MKLYSEITYKDGNRVWWRLRIYRTTRTKTTRYVKSDFEFKDRVWEYALAMEDFGVGCDDGYADVFRGWIRGQYDTPPTTRDCIMDWLGYMNSVAAGFCVQEQVQCYQRSNEKESQKKPGGEPNAPN